MKRNDPRQNASRVFDAVMARLPLALRLTTESRGNIVIELQRELDAGNLEYECKCEDAPAACRAHPEGERTPAVNISFNNALPGSALERAREIRRILEEINGGQ
tara:strand:+ start:299 stop:610 length:312 start_codon:yes stop_codon:yes gene_type:complete